GVAPPAAPSAPRPAADPGAETKPMQARPESPAYDIHSVPTKPMTSLLLPLVYTPLETSAPVRAKAQLPLWLIAVLCGVVGLVGFVLFKNEAGPPVPVIQSFTADRAQVQPGQQAILSWSVQGDADVTI